MSFEHSNIDDSIIINISAPPCVLNTATLPATSSSTSAHHHEFQTQQHCLQHPHQHQRTAMSVEHSNIDDNIPINIKAPP
jgi:hypothetical protein